MLVGIEELGGRGSDGKEGVEEKYKMASHLLIAVVSKMIIRLLLDDDNRLILDPVMRSVSGFSFAEIFESC